ncbi:MAG: hypothetical protein P4K80_02135 [Acidobacteriaceae bacterium]|nr:hypothetical protein [Acidobacteriaceae bacterium]
MTIVTFGFLGVVAACILSSCLYLLAKRRPLKEGQNRRSITIKVVMAPFIGLVWLVFALLLHVETSNRLAHQDCGLSGDPYVTLPNGYVLGSHNTYDGYIKAPGYETDVPVAGPGYVRSIIDLQFTDGNFVGTQFDFKTSSVRRFIYDTRTQEFSSSPEGPLSWDAANTNAQEGANSYWKLYAQYRHYWPNYILLVLIIAGEGSIGFWVWKA